MLGQSKRRRNIQKKKKWHLYMRAKLPCPNGHFMTNWLILCISFKFSRMNENFQVSNIVCLQNDQRRSYTSSHTYNNATEKVAGIFIPTYDFNYMEGSITISFDPYLEDIYSNSLLCMPLIFIS